EPPARVLLPEQDHQQRGQEQESSGTARDGPAAVVSGVRAFVSPDRSREDQDRDRGEEPEEGRRPIEVSVRVRDRELDGIRLWARWLLVRLHVCAKGLRFVGPFSS